MVTRQMPPVMVRGGNKLGYQSKGRRNKHRVKRRYDIALSTPDTPGVEIRLPSFPVVKLGWRVLSFTIVGCLIWMLYYFWNSPVFQIHVVEVRGALRLSPEDIIRTLNVYNKPIFTINPKQVEESLTKTYSELTNISVQIALPAQVLVDVNERVPMISWIHDNEPLWIDGNGFVYKPQGNADKLVLVHANTSPPLAFQVQKDDGSMDIGTDGQGLMPFELVSAIFKLKSSAPEGTRYTH